MAERSRLGGMIDDYNTPMKVEAFQGSVIVDGPGAVLWAFTPDAAEESAMRLLMAASEARVWINPALGRPRHLPEQ